MIRDDVEFTRNLTKGKIAETVFWMMFRDNRQYAVLPFGYEYLVPEIARYRRNKLVNGQKTIERISTNPDFILMSKDKKIMLPVDIKFMWDLNKNLPFLIEKAEKTLETWEECWYFVVTPEGFYFNPCKYITRNKKLDLLSSDYISIDTQQEYLDLIKEFLQLRAVKDKNGSISIICKCYTCQTTIEYPLKSDECPRCHNEMFKQSKKSAPSKLGTKIENFDNENHFEQCEYCLKAFVSKNKHDTICPYCNHDNYWKT